MRRPAKCEGRYVKQHNACVLLMCLMWKLGSVEKALDVKQNAREHG